MHEQEENNKRCIGTYYETIAMHYLEEKGYSILERNYRCYLGEIDLIAYKDNYTIFIEVKYRKNRCYGYPREAVNLKKQQRIRRVAAFYMKARYQYECACRFDVIEILQEQLTHLEAAF